MLRRVVAIAIIADLEFFNGYQSKANMLVVTNKGDVRDVSNRWYVTKVEVALSPENVLRHDFTKYSCWMSS
jgi:hypothetical protein